MEIINDPKKPKKVAEAPIPGKNEHLSPPVSTKNLASRRLANLRAKIQAEADSTTISETQKREERVSPIATVTEANNNADENKTDDDEEISDATECKPVHNIPPPKQFLVVNKIISSIKAQLKEGYTEKIVTKDRFADIEEEINKQSCDYPIIKQPSTPPQFLEASKLVSSIKSKLEPKKGEEVRRYSSANDRLAALRKDLIEDVNSAAEKLNVSDSAIPELYRQTEDKKMDVDNFQVIIKYSYMLCLLFLYVTDLLN